MQSPPAADPEQHLVNYVPDEVCVIVQAPAALDRPRLYGQVRAAVNAALVDELRQPPLARADDALSADLDPTQLRRRFQPGLDILQPLERPGVSPNGATAAGVRQPWHVLATSSGQATWHLYYAVGAQRVDFDARHLDVRLQHLAAIRELVNLLNRHATGRPQLLESKHDWALVGGTPNWLVAAAQMACGCPAGLPIAESRTGTWRFRFDPMVERALEGEPTTQVVVAILDTAPESTSVPDHGNAYLADLLRTIHIDSTPDSSAALHPGHFDRPIGVGQYWESCRLWWHANSYAQHAAAADVAIQDHGLFVAGIVHDVAPHAEIHLIRVLNDIGIGDGLGLGHILSELPGALRIGNGRRLIVNLSLGAAIPVPPRRHWARWLPETRRRAAGQLPRPEPAVQGVLDAAHASLLDMMHWLHRQGVLVVAAAGNDALRPETHEHDTPPPPRYPARYQEVLAVAAAGPQGLPASYSNRADVAPLGNGITCFGGDVAPGQTPDTPATTAAGIAGVYSANSLPSGQPNTTGWVQWAGTSFSAPIIAGIAARLWSQDGQLQPTTLMQRLRSFAMPVPSGQAPQLDPDGPLDAPLLNTWQEYRPPPGAHT